MAGEPLKVIASAFVEIDIETWRLQYMSEAGAENELEEQIKSNMLNFTLIGIFGLKDKIRDKVPSIIKYAKANGGIEVRMITGDHLQTA
jgi:magnesium-transporting ATPase (P-type)